VAQSGGSKGRSNKGMKLTSVERIGRSQLIPSVRRTCGEFGGSEKALQVTSDGLAHPLLRLAPRSAKRVIEGTVRCKAMYRVVDALQPPEDDRPKGGPR
jgi:hypothetical protein